MKIYLCKSCHSDMEKKIPEPCLLTVDGDGEFPLFCPYTQKEAKFKQKFPKNDN